MGGRAKEFLFPVRFVRIVLLAVVSFSIVRLSVILITVVRLSIESIDTLAQLVFVSFE